MNFEKNDPFFNINTKEDLEKAKKYISWLVTTVLKIS
jgi:GTP:adenosylcobinamide-phosphate guanylyltransferase